MSVYYCENCDYYFDDDYEPCSEDPKRKLGLLCPDCSLNYEEEIETEVSKNNGEEDEYI